MEGKRATETTAGNIAIPNHGKIGGLFKLSPTPKFAETRGKYFDEIYAKQQAQLAARPKREIDITLPDGKVMKGTSWETTGLEIAKKISKKLAEAAVAIKVVYSKKDDSEFNKEIADADAFEDHLHVEKGELYDLTRPLEGDCSLEILKFDDPLGKTVFWHSSAHLLGATLEQEFGGYLCAGPPLENGFFYDVYIGTHKVTPDQFEKLEKKFKEIAAKDYPFQKIYLTKPEALQLFGDNPFKVQLLTHKIPDNAMTTAYKCGPLIDLCTGPHLPSTGRVKAFKITKSSAAYWLAKNTNDDLQRVYGVTYPTEKELQEYIRIQEELEKRDHRNVGVNQELFFFSLMSPGSAFFYPHGAIIYNRFVDLIKKEYRYRGYSEVMTPNMYNVELWRKSGHWFKYKENMFNFPVEEQPFALKPMNCPGHCLMFDSILRSYRELPLRFADFGVLHRNELSGALSGLTRVRRFQQDDAHVFCTTEQIQDEITDCLEFIEYVYTVLGFESHFELSTRPETALGDQALWDKAEAALAEALNKTGKKWKINPGDGAFYGPKIDVKVYDVYKREHQLGTIQLDFNLPFRFNLQYRSTEVAEHDESEQSVKSEKTAESTSTQKKEKKEKVKKEKKAKGEKGAEGEEKKAEEAAATEEKPQEEEQKVEEKAPEPHVHVEKNLDIPDVMTDETNHLKTGFQRPVMIHRAVLGSVERMFAIMCEQTGGKWPFWLSPRQVKVIPISEKSLEYAEKVHERLRLEGFATELEKSNSTINKKVRNAEIAQFNFIAVVGEEEKKQGTIALRERGNKEKPRIISVDELVSFLTTLQPPPSKAQLRMQAASYFNDNSVHEGENLDQHNQELQLKSFLEGTTEPGEKDKSLFEKLKEYQIDSKKHPNLFRWKNFVSSHLESKK